MELRKSKKKLSAFVLLMLLLLLPDLPVLEKKKQAKLVLNKKAFSGMSVK